MITASHHPVTAAEVKDRSDVLNEDNFKIGKICSPKLSYAFTAFLPTIDDSSPEQGQRIVCTASASGTPNPVNFQYQGATQITRVVVVVAHRQAPGWRCLIALFLQRQLHIKRTSMPQWMSLKLISVQMQQSQLTQVALQMGPLQQL